MSERLDKYWFQVRGSSDSMFSYVVYAADESEVLRQLGVLAEGKELKRLTWSDLIEIFGVAITDDTSSNDYATGDLCILRGRHIIHLWMPSTS